MNVVFRREVHCVEGLPKIVVPRDVKMDILEANGVERVLHLIRLIVILASRFAKVKVELFVLQVFSQAQIFNVVKLKIVKVP
jgi:hypothetical protein